jgi:phage baseplate assembly protein W
MSKENPIYTDANNEFKINDFTKDLILKIDRDAVRQSVINLLKTKHYDRCFHPEIGSAVDGLMFKPAISYYLEIAKNEIKHIIGTYEPRVNIIELDIWQDDNNPSFITVKLDYEILKIGVIDTYEFRIQRVL